MKTYAQFLAPAQTHDVETGELFEKNDVKFIVKEAARMKAFIQYNDHYVLDTIAKGLFDYPNMRKYVENKPSSVYYVMETKHGVLSYHFDLHIDSENDDERYKFTLSNCKVYFDGFLVFVAEDYEYIDTCLKISLDFLKTHM